MKHFRCLGIVPLVLLMAFALPLAASAKTDKTVERGMTKSQVVAVCGKPMATSFDEVGEKWTYKKVRGGLLAPYEVSITVEFDADGKVVRYSEVLPEGSRVEEEPQAPAATVVARPRFGGRRNAPLTDADFNILASKVKGASFDDRKLDLIQVACLGCWLTCRQGASLVAAFSFTDGRMKALGIVAPRLVDLQNTNEIYRLFTFSSDKDKAAEIISRSQQ